MEEKTLKAQQTYKTLCTSFDNNGWHYDRHDDDLVITCSMSSDDLPIDHMISVLAKQQVVMLLSRLPFTVPKEKALDIAIAVCVINDKLADGCFDYKMEDGSVYFRQTTSFLESELGEELFPRMVSIASTTVDAFNDKLFMLVKGMLTIEQFLQEQL
ncbi:MAG: hypothetical protein J6J43_05470 [Oscillospiraceae bacterium]|nr:hypothetical protein [Oscillospiraceae bacterium]